MRIRVITASAGSGKTTRLSRVLDEAISSARARPESIVATTFTREAAAELVERARERLLASGNGRAAHELLAARIGTVNSVCGALVGELAFELGLSPELRVLDEAAAQLEQARALAAVVTPEVAERLQWFTTRFEQQLDWRDEVRRLIEASRANGIAAEALAGCAARSIETLDACLGPCEPDGEAIDAALRAAIEDARAQIDPARDTTQKTAAYLALLDEALRGLDADDGPRWGTWAKLAREEPAVRSRPAARPVAAAAARHLGHPRLRDELHELVRRLFAIAADGLAAYAAHKRARGLLDFVDQEAYALELLRRPDVREALDGQLELVLVDEFQDTSPLQLAVFVELAALARESVWVGDQKQAIFGFRGTDPALMDAVIESLTGTANDPELVQAALAAAGQAGVETLGVSYRSRPELVALTSEIFARAFARQGIPEERTRLRSALEVEPAGLGPIVEHWPIVLDGRANKQKLAGGAAAGVRALLAGQEQVRDRATGVPRLLRADDVAVLCRTNEQCQLVADALTALGVPAVVARMGLLDTCEGQLVLAGVRLWVDPRDALAAAVLARVISYPEAFDALVRELLASPALEALAARPEVAALLAARAADPDLPPAAVVRRVIDVLGLRELCAGLGDAAQRQANLDALVAHAVAYTNEAVARRDAATLVGLLGHLADLADTSDWGATRRDRQARPAGVQAVEISTWHRAKGREWPVTVLFGLETLRAPSPYGLQVVGDERAFDLEAPLAGRWLRYWPNPYINTMQGGAVREAYEASPAFARVVERAEREALRLLYVGWTRARDRLVLCAEQGKLLDGLLGKLRAVEPALVTEPRGDRAGEVEVRWAGRALTVRVRPTAPEAPAPAPPRPGDVTVGRAAAAYPPARTSPSDAGPVPCTIGEVVILGDRLRLRGDPAMNALGEAVHGFLAADAEALGDEARRALAAGLLTRHAVAGALEPADLVAAGTRLWRWLATLAPDRLEREWPVAQRLPEGTVLAGTVDLVAASPAGLVVIDHKSFPGSDEQALRRAEQHSGQLASYAGALSRARGVPVRSLWIHLPLLGRLVELRVPAQDAR